MTAAILVSLSGFAVVGVVVLARYLDGRVWRRSLVAYKLTFPGSLKSEDVARWIASVSASTHAASWSLLPQPPVVLEHVATRTGISTRLLVARSNENVILSGLRAHLPGVRVTEEPEPAVAGPGRLSVAAEARLTSRLRPLGIDRAEATTRGVLSALQPLVRSERIVVQMVMTSAGTPKPVHTASPKRGDAWWSAYLEHETSKDAEAVRAQRLKDREPQVQAAIRVGVYADSRKRALRLFGGVWPHLHTMNAPGVRLVRRWLPSGVVADRMTRYALPLTIWPMSLNASEAAGFSAVPTSGVYVAGVATGSARQLPPSPTMPSRGLVIGRSNWPGLADRTLALSVADRLRHHLILGPTGVGKSTLMVNMALQDIAAGYGTIVIDPKSDMVSDLLARIPAERAEDVLLIDPATTARPVGLNVLHSGFDEHARERAADNITHVFSEIWRSSFGPRTADVLRNGLLCLTHTRAPDGTAFTLVELPELLTSPTLRRYVLAQPGVPESIRPFFHWFEAISEAERAAIIAPSLNKLRALTTRSSLRLILGQTGGLDLGDVFRRRKVLLVALSKGTVGTETANLLGALIMSAIWETTLTRMAIAQEARRPVFAYIDEAADVVRLPVALSDVLSQARGLGLGITMATQFLGQLPEPIKLALLGTARTTTVFQADYKDARELEPRFAPLTADDLMGLSAYEVALRPSVGGQTLSPVTAVTLPLGEPLRAPDALAAVARERHGVERAAVELAMRRRIEVQAHGRLGREPRGNRS